MSGQRVLVLGAGTGGLVAANHLAHRGYNVTVVEEKEYHLFQPGMLWIAFRGHRPERYMRRVKDLLDPRASLVRGRVAGIDLGERRVTLEDGRSLDYDVLIVALGASLDYDAIPGHRGLLEAFGDYYAGPWEAARLWEHVRSLREGRLVIAAGDPLYKCPPAPHKAAFLAADTLRAMGSRAEVVLALPFTRPYPAEPMSGIIEEKLEEKGVMVETMFTVDSVENGRLLSLEGGELEYTLATVIPPHRGPRVEVEPGEAVDEDGFIRVDRHTLQVRGYDDAYAIGDCNDAPTSKTGVTAHLGAEVVVERLEGLDSRFEGRTNCPVVADGEASFIITKYGVPAVRARFTRFKRLLEDVFIAAYWSSLRYPWRWKPLFDAYFQATDPRALGGEW